MNRLLLSLTFSLVWLYSYGQKIQECSLYYYIETAKENSPLITDYRNQTEIEQAELKRLKAMYTHSRLELNGDYLFVPVSRRTVDEPPSNGMRGRLRITTVTIWERAVDLSMPERLGRSPFWVGVPTR